LLVNSNDFVVVQVGLSEPSAWSNVLGVGLAEDLGAGTESDLGGDLSDEGYSQSC
jgi:hypothetical protein